MEIESMAEVRPEGGTRAQLLAITERLMSAAGYEGVAIKDIAAVAGVRPAAIFYHFPTKADLVAAALDASVNVLTGRLAEFDRLNSGPIARVRAFIEYFGTVKRARNEFCFAGVLAASCKGLPENVAVGVKRFEAQLAAWAAGHFREAFPDLSDDKVRAKGEAVLALAEGALLATRMSGDHAAYDRVVAALLPSLIER